MLYWKWVSARTITFQLANWATWQTHCFLCCAPPNSMWKCSAIKMFVDISKYCAHVNTFCLLHWNNWCMEVCPKAGIVLRWGDLSGTWFLVHPTYVTLILQPTTWDSRSFAFEDIGAGQFIHTCSRCSTKWRNSLLGPSNSHDAYCGITNKFRLPQKKIQKWHHNPCHVLQWSCISFAFLSYLQYV